MVFSETGKKTLPTAKNDMHPKSWTLLEVHIFYVKRKEI